MYKWHRKSGVSLPISSMGASAGVAIGECGGTPGETPFLLTCPFVSPKPVLANDVYHCGIFDT
jgi:hypothetical protein